MYDILLAGAYAGGVAGVLLTLASHVAPWFGAGNFVRDLDEPCVFGKAISHREAHFLGILVHMIVCILSGVGFAFFVTRGWLSGFAVLPMLCWAIGFALFSGLVIMPLEGHGFFGRRHDAWFMIDGLLTNLFWGGLYLLLVRLWV